MGFFEGKDICETDDTLLYKEGLSSSVYEELQDMSSDSYM